MGYNHPLTLYCLIVSLWRLINRQHSSSSGIKTQKSHESSDYPGNLKNKTKTDCSFMLQTGSQVHNSDYPIAHSSKNFKPDLQFKILPASHPPVKFLLCGKFGKWLDRRKGILLPCTFVLLFCKSGCDPFFHGIGRRQERLVDRKTLT